MEASLDAVMRYYHITMGGSKGAKVVGEKGGVRGVSGVSKQRFCPYLLRTEHNLFFKRTLFTDSFVHVHEFDWTILRKREGNRKKYYTHITNLPYGWVLCMTFSYFFSSFTFWALADWCERPRLGSRGAQHHIPWWRIEVGRWGRGRSLCLVVVF